MRGFGTLPFALLSLLLVTGLLQAQAKKAVPEKDVAELIADLKARDAETRLKAAKALTEKGSTAAPAVPALIDCLQAPGEEVRQEVAVALGKIGKPAVADLGRLLRHEEEAVRFHALAALLHTGRDAQPVREEIVRAVRDKDPEVRYLAVRALSQLGLKADELVPLLLKAAREEDCDVSRAGEEELAELGEDAIPALCRALKDRDGYWIAGRALCTNKGMPSGADFADVLAVLLTLPDDANRRELWEPWLLRSKSTFFVLNKSLFDRNRDTRLHQVRLLWWFTVGEPSPVDGEIVEAIRETLDAKNPIDAALKGPAARMKADSGQVSALLLARMLRDEDDEIRETACSHLGDWQGSGRGSADLVGGVLWQALRDKQLWVRLEAARALTSLGQDVKPQLMDDLKQGDRRQVHAATVLVKLDTADTEAAKVLRSALEKEDADLRAQAAAALAVFDPDMQKEGRPGKLMQKCLAVLTERLKADKAGERYFAARTLRMMETHAAPAVPALLDALESRDARVREEVLKAIGGAVRGEVVEGKFIGVDSAPFPTAWVVRPDARTTLPRLAKLLDDPDVRVRRTLIDVLKSFGGDAAEYLALATKDPDNHWHAHDALFQVRENGQKAVPVLRAMLDDPKQAEDAAWSLRSIDPVASFPHIRDMLKRTDSQVRQSLEDAGKIGRTPGATVRGLAHLLDDDDVNVRGRAAHSLYEIGLFLAEEDRHYVRTVTDPLLKKQIPDCTERLHSKDLAVRRQAISELLALGRLHRLPFDRLGGWDELREKLQAAIDAALNAARDDADVEVRRKARAATRKFLHPRLGA